MHSFTLGSDWEQLTTEMPMWGLSSPDNDERIELVVQETDHSDGYVILHRDLSRDHPHFDTLSRVTDIHVSEPSSDETIETTRMMMKELVWFLAHHIKNETLDEPTSWVVDEFNHINPENPGAELQTLIDFLTEAYGYTHAESSNPAYVAAVEKIT